MIPTLFLLSILVFLSVRFIPGDVVDIMVAKLHGWGGGYTNREVLERVLGLDVPVHVQYGRWIGVLPTPDWKTGESQFSGILQGTLGKSLYATHLSIEEQVLERLPVTLELGLMAIVIGLVIALPVGIYSAIRQDTATDYLGRSIAIIGLATPNFWLAIMVILYPAIWWGWAPSIKYIPLVEDPLGNLVMFLIPSVILGTAMAAETMRMTRTMMLGFKAGLHPHRLVQRAQGAGRGDPARHQECPHPDSYLDRPALAPPDRGLRYHGRNICSAGDRSFIPGCNRDQRLPGGPGNQPVFRHRGSGDQSLHRPDLCFPGPQGSV